MPLQATSGAASYDAFGGGVPVVPAYIEDVFSTYLYNGNSAGLTINNGIDLSTKGGMVWGKTRNAANRNVLFDTVRGPLNELSSNLTDAQVTHAQSLTSFTSTGYTLGTDDWTSYSSTFQSVSWTFRKQPKFFDVVTYTGTGSAQNIAHNLGSVPGAIIVKRTSSVEDWLVYHRSTGNQAGTGLNETAATYTGVTAYWNSTTPTDSVFTVNTHPRVNTSGETYVAYIFAHDAGGFGLTGTDNVISCGSYTGNNTSLQSINLGYEPQWILIKSASISGTEWAMLDNMRGVATGGVDAVLNPNTSGAEASPYDRVDFTSTGFNLKTSSSIYNETGTYIYIAIRRGPMKVPTSGTSVFAPVAYTGNGSTQIATTGFPVDAMIEFERTNSSGVPAAGGKYMTDRLRGSSAYLETSGTSAEGTGFVFGLANNTGVNLSTDFNSSSKTYIIEAFRRAPGFFDEVCYTGNGTGGRTVTHNLGVAPELMIFKNRTTSGLDWIVGGTVFADPTADQLKLNTTGALQSGSSWNYTAPTSTTITLSSSANLNANGANYVSYLFATCAGVSKVGSYTGTATTKQIDCGFTGGARFVLIKRTDSTGSWYVWDSSRGIVSGNDPYLLLNSTAAEVTNTDYIDTYSAGFEISSTAPAEINASGGSFIFLAIS